jgi:hypothetical protein
MELTSLVLAACLLGQSAPAATEEPRYPSQLPRSAPVATPTAPTATVPDLPAGLDVPPPLETQPKTPPALSAPTRAPQRAPARIEGTITEPAAEPAAPPSEPPLVSARSRQPKSGTDELLASMLSLPDALKTSGRPLTLTEALGASSDRQQQIDITLAYWKLTKAAAEEHFCWSENQLLEQLQTIPHRTSSGASRLELDSLVASSKATLREAGLQMITAQYELAELLRLPSSTPLPLPSDRPHVGPYKTYFEQIYSGRAVPARARLVDRALPLIKQAIDVHASAVQAAYDMVDASSDAYQQGTASLATVLACSESLKRERRAFISSVGQYNRDIASYALAIAPPGMPTESLVGMLIKTENTPTSPANPIPTAATANPSGVNPATFNQPLEPQAAPAGISGGLQPLRTGEPTLAPPRPTGTPADTAGDDVTSSPTEPAAAFGPQEVRRPPVEDERYPAVAAPANRLPTRAVDPAEVQAIEAQPVEARAAEVQQPTGIRRDVQAAEQVGLYPALAELSAAKRAQELANLLNWDRVLPDKTGIPVSLKECVDAVSGDGRKAVIEAFWTAREKAACYQVIAQKIDQLEALSPATLAARRTVGGSDAMLELRFAKQAANAQLIEAQLALLNAQWALTELTHRPMDGAWLLPSTTPHGGGYRLKFESQRASVAESLPMRRLAATIPQMHRTLEDRASAVLLIDACRADLSAQFESGAMSIVQTLAAIDRQANETLAFLHDLTEYNIEIADYALAVLPPDVSSATLVGALIVARPSTARAGL